MGWFVASGAICLGIVVGWMAGQTFVQIEKMSVTALGAIVGVMVSGAVIGLFQHFLGNNLNGVPAEVWLYPVGLFVGAFCAVTASYLQQMALRRIQLTREARVLAEADARAAEAKAAEAQVKAEAAVTAAEAIAKLAREEVANAAEKAAQMAKQVILNLFKYKKWTVASFEGIRATTGQDWSDDFLVGLRVRFPDTFTKATLLPSPRRPRNRPGLKLHPWVKNS
jgi:hypothetical protein